MTVHEWRMRTADGPRLYRAQRFGKKWRLISRLKSEDEWIEHEAPYAADVLISLRDVLWNKYQRKRLPFEVVVEIDAQLPAEQRRTLTES
jgi:hypothetical protein